MSAQLQNDLAALQMAGTFLTSEDVREFCEGSHSRLYEKLGARLVSHEGAAGVHFGVWAPNAKQVSVMGDFNDWNKQTHPLTFDEPSGIWSGFVPRVREAATYKYYIISEDESYRVDKADPFAFCHENPPQTASLVWDLAYEWSDGEWMQRRGRSLELDQPISIYEVHLGSWRRTPEASRRPLSYREVAPELADYVRAMGFTHVELLPVMEHPFYGSWGYQTTGYFAPTSRYGAPQDFMFLVDYLHQHGIGVILDWVPSHFPTDEHGLVYFDGTHVYEPSDPRRRFHPDWNTCLFDYARPEVRSFLLSSALFWLDKYHADGLRVDAVASMLYLDHARKPGEWIPNEFGGNENLPAIDFLRTLNESIAEQFPNVRVFAEESTAWPAVSRPTYLGGLGFSFKWDMGFRHDTLKYFARDPIVRKHHHNELTFRGLYLFDENFVLPFSHDDVTPVHGSLLDRMPGDRWQKLANLRLLLGYAYLQPGKKLLFMGCEFGQSRPWNHDSALDWPLLSDPAHLGIQKWLADLNHVYREEPAVHQGDAASWGFEWVDCHDADQSTISWLRWSAGRESVCLAVFNFTPVPRHNFRVGVPRGGFWKEILNSDATIYGGSGRGNLGGVESSPLPWHGRDHSLTITLPPLGCVVFRSET